MLIVNVDREIFSPHLSLKHTIHECPPGARRDTGTEDTKLTCGSSLQESLSGERTTEIEMQFEVCLARQTTNMPGLLGRK